MENQSLIEELIKLREEFEKFKLQFDEHALLVKMQNKQVEERPFGMLSLPSKGLFYKAKNKFLLIGLLTYYEEHILTSEMMHEVDIAMPLILEKVIMDNKFDIKEILACDVQAISMFLRAYSYGNDIEIDIECPHCDKKNKHNIKISNFQSKDIIIEPDNNDEMEVFSNKYNIQMKIRPRTYFEELSFKKNGEPKQVDLMSFYLTEFKGERDVNKIRQQLASLKIMESRDVKKAIFDNLPGIDATIEYVCEFCEKSTQINFGSNGADFLKLPSTFMNNVLEEIFLISHYGANISITDAKKMPVGERRWMLNRISEELTKKREAEEAEIRKSRNRKK